MDQRIQDTIAMIDTSLTKDQQVSSHGGGGEGSSGVSTVDVVCFLCWFYSGGGIDCQFGSFVEVGGTA
jgi:hypothetical protein